MSNVNTTNQDSKQQGTSQPAPVSGNPILKVKQILRDIDEEITSYEKSITTAADHLKFLQGHVSGLRRSKTALEIFFQNDLKGVEANHV